MNDEQLAKFVTTATEQILALERLAIQLKASVNTLKVVLASELNRNHPEKALALFRQIEEKLLNADPHAQEHEEFAEMHEAIKLWEQHGKHEA
jgi:hypothetical protein